MVLKGKQIQKASLKINNNRIDNELQIANGLNKYIVFVGQTVAANLKPTRLNPIDILQMNPHSMVFTHIEKKEIVTIINSHNNNSPCCDIIPSVLVVLSFLRCELYLNTLCLVRPGRGLNPRPSALKTNCV